MKLVHIFYFIVLPMLLLAGLGFVLQRRLGLDMPTLTRLNFYFVVPAMMFFAVVASPVSGAQAATAAWVSVCMIAAMFILTLAIAVVMRLGATQRRVMVMTTIFHNAGNYGLPLQGLAFETAGLAAMAMSLQSFVMLTQNVAIFTLGVLLVTGGRQDRHWKDNLLHIVKFPPLYAITAALLTVYFRTKVELPADFSTWISPFWKAMLYVKDAFIAVALLTLGAQLATVRRVSQPYPVKTSVFLRLIAGPTVALGLVLLFDIRGLLAQVLLIGMATPTGINSMLLCLQFGNHPEYAARAVFYSTILSPITVTCVVFLAQADILPSLRLENAPDRPPPPAVSKEDPSGRDGPDDRAAGRPATPDGKERSMSRKTVISIQKDQFFINGRPTYEGRYYRGMKIEGLLLNSRMVQGIFDDLNPQTRSMWNYPEGPWNPDRNTAEFVQAMPAWREYGLLSFTINLQGGAPLGYADKQPWHNSAFEADGSLRADYMARLEKILDKADELGMAPIVGLFYFGQDHRLADEPAVIRAVENATDWILARGYRNVLIEIGNEVDLGGKYEKHPIIQAKRGDELIRMVQHRSAGKVDSPGGRLLVSTSMCGNHIPPDCVAAAADFLLIHGNGVGSSDRIRQMVDQCRSLPGFHGQPVLFNEDDHFDFDKDDNHMLAAIGMYASWGLFDYRMKGEGFDEGFQCPPVNWGISSPRKRGFFDLVKKITSE